MIHSINLSLLASVLCLFLASCGEQAKRTPRDVACPFCSGEGRISGTCSPCNGTGNKAKLFGDPTVCSACGGTGSSSINCWRCGGTGRR